MIDQSLHVCSIYNEFVCMCIFSTCVIMYFLYSEGLNLEFFGIHCTKLDYVIESHGAVVQLDPIE